MQTTHRRQDCKIEIKFYLNKTERNTKTKSPGKPKTSQEDKRQVARKRTSKAKYKSMKTQGTKSSNIPWGDTRDVAVGKHRVASQEKHRGEHEWTDKNMSDQKNNGIQNGTTKKIIRLISLKIKETSTHKAMLQDHTGSLETYMKQKMPNLYVVRLTAMFHLSVLLFLTLLPEKHLAERARLLPVLLVVIWHGFEWKTHMSLWPSIIVLL